MNNPKCSSITSLLFSFHVNIRLHINNADLRTVIKNHLFEKLPSGFYVYREQHLGITIIYIHLYFSWVDYSIVDIHRSIGTDTQIAVFNIIHSKNIYNCKEESIIILIF